MVTALHGVPHRRRSDSESAPEPAEHLAPASEATPLPFSLAPSSSTGSEQRGKYLDRGKHLVAAAVRDASILSICPHAKRVASVPLQCTTHELVPAGADELGAPEEESESEEGAAPHERIIHVGS